MSTPKDSAATLADSFDTYEKTEDHGLVIQLLHTMEFPTEIIEEGFARAQIESVNGHTCARIVWPERPLSDEESIRLELRAISLWNMRPVQ